MKLFGGPQADERRREAALREQVRQQAKLRPGYKLWGYKNVFAKGFVGLPGAAPEAPVDHWVSISLGHWHFRLDPLLDHQIAESPVASVMVLGQAFDDGGPKARSRIARMLLSALGAAPETQHLDEIVSGVSGRYLVFALLGQTLYVYGDPLATRSCFWHKLPDGRVALASHTALLAEMAGGLPATEMTWVLKHPEYVSPAGRWLPGRITPHDHVDQVYANGRLRIDADGGVQHERFFPLRDRVERGLGEVRDEFREELRQQVRNWASVAPSLVLTLTAGGDSLAVLESSLDLLQEADAVALTYHPFHNAKKSTYSDLVTANRRATSAGLRHLVLDVTAMSRTSPMGQLYLRTFPTWQRYAALAQALYLGAPARAATLFGVGGAVITGMITDRSDRHLTPQLLARKYAYSGFARDSRLHEVFDDWCRWTQFDVDALRGYDFYDFFHWEHRMSKWGGMGYSEYDLATIPAPVLSSRRLLTAALALSWETRRSGQLYSGLGLTGQ